MPGLALPAHGCLCIDWLQLARSYHFSVVRLTNVSFQRVEDMQRELHTVSGVSAWGSCLFESSDMLRRSGKK